VVRKLATVLVLKIVDDWLAGNPWLVGVPKRFSMWYSSPSSAKAAAAHTRYSAGKPLAEALDGVHSRGAGNWSQLMAGSGGSQDLPSSASRMASSAVMP